MIKWTWRMVSWTFTMYEIGPRRCMMVPGFHFWEPLKFLTITEFPGSKALTLVCFPSWLDFIWSCFCSTFLDSDGFSRLNLILGLQLRKSSAWIACNLLLYAAYCGKSVEYLLHDVAMWNRYLGWCVKLASNSTHCVLLLHCWKGGKEV